jgi:hypothetical protein
LNSLARFSEEFEMDMATKAVEWRKRIRECESSGESQRRWCARNGISLSTLKNWQRRLESTAAGAGLVPVVLTEARDAVGTSSAAIEVSVGSMRLRVSPGVDPAWLSAVLRGLL